MNICILHGNELSRNSDRASEVIKKSISKIGDVKFIEFHLPRDVPYLCQGCYECVSDSSYLEEDKCHFARAIHEVIMTLKNCDAIIICASVFSLSSDGHIKSFLDHFANKTDANNMPIKNAFKSALIVSMTPKSEVEPSVRALSDTLLNWGAHRVHYTSMTIWGKLWAGMPPEKQEQCKKLLDVKAQLFYSSL